MVNRKTVPKNRLTVYAVTGLNGYGYGSQIWWTDTSDYRLEILFRYG